MNILNIKHSLSLLMFFLLLFSGCATKVDRLEYALEFAGENRRELEKKCWNIIVMTALNFVQHVS